MDITAFTATLKHQLIDYLQESGSVLYSDNNTLQAGDIYLMGFNPGGTGGPALGQQIDLLASKTTNAYLDEDWSNDNGSWPAGEAPLQRRVIWVLEQLGYQPRNVCSSNLIFLQSRQAQEIDYHLADVCWPIHQKIISIVKPKLIIAFGNSGLSPYNYLNNKFNAGHSSEFTPSGHGDWCIKGFQAEINNQNTYIVGLPHLSRYSPIGKHDIIEWIKTRIPSGQ